MTSGCKTPAASEVRHFIFYLLYLTEFTKKRQWVEGTQKACLELSSHFQRALEQPNPFSVLLPYNSEISERILCFCMAKEDNAIQQTGVKSVTAHLTKETVVLHAHLRCFLRTPTAR